MSNLLTIPNELLDEIVSNLDPLATLNLLLTCRSISSRGLPAMHLHAVAPKENMPALHWAAMKGHLPLVEYLLTVFPVDLSDDFGDTPLHGAARSCHAVVTEHLLLHGADVNRIDHEGTPPLVFASAAVSTHLNAAEDTVQILLAHGADVQGTAAAAPLRNAIVAFSARMARLLLDAGASPDTKSWLGEPIIISAAWNPGARAVLEVLLDHGADVNATSNDGHSALMLAAQAGLLETVQILVDRGANLTLVDIHGHSVFAYAAMGYQPHVVEYLVGCDGFDIHAEGLVYQMISYECDAALKILLQRGASPNGVDEIGGQSVLHTAVLRRSATAVRTLLQNGADIAGDHRGLTPLMVAIEMDNLPIVKILLEYWTPHDAGADVFQTLMLACGRRSKEIVELLLEKGVDINMVDTDGVTVMAHAKKAGWDNVVAMMASYGADRVGDPGGQDYVETSSEIEL